jgi:hypothetical protein
MKAHVKPGRREEETSMSRAMREPRTWPTNARPFVITSFMVGPAMPPRLKIAAQRSVWLAALLREAPTHALRHRGDAQ